jgi:uncharacterized protein (UPF0332 family)
LLSKGRLRSLDLKPDERLRRVAELLSVAGRELSDAALNDRSPDGRHNSAYAAARVAAEAMMTAEGLRRGSGEGQHAIVFDFLALVEEGHYAKEAAYFHRVRRLRNETEYERAGVIAPSLADDVLSKARNFVEEARRWTTARLAADKPPTDT